jgi:nicotinate (nicotinamide) nucleotide adenylyltransferase
MIHYYFNIPLKYMMRFILIGGTYSPPHAGHLSLIQSVMTTYAHDKENRIMLLPSADGSPVLGKKPTASQQNRYHMASMMARAINRTLLPPPMVSVSDLEITLGSMTGMPSYTANTVLVLRHENLLTVHEKTGSAAEQERLIHMRSARICHYLNKPHHPCLTANGIVHNNDEIILVYGADSLQQMSQWYDLKTLTEAVTQLYIIPRANVDMQAAKDALIRTHPALAQKIIFSKHTAGLSQFASSTQVRQAILCLSASSDESSQEEARNLLKNTVSADILQYIHDHHLYSI